MFRLRSGPWSPLRPSILKSGLFDHCRGARRPQRSAKDFGNTNALVKNDHWDIAVSKTGYISRPAAVW